MSDVDALDIRTARLAEQASTNTQLLFQRPTTGFVASINSIAGNIIFNGGTSGFDYSTGAPNITLVSPLTTKGDLYARNATVGTRLGVGTDGFILVADSTAATGVKWAASGTAGPSATTELLIWMGL